MNVWIIDILKKRDQNFEPFYVPRSYPRPIDRYTKTVISFYITLETLHTRQTYQLINRNWLKLKTFYAQTLIKLFNQRRIGVLTNVFSIRCYRLWLRPVRRRDSVNFTRALRRLASTPVLVRGGSWKSLISAVHVSYNFIMT